jgi:hypothetical protein
MDDQERAERAARDAEASMRLPAGLEDAGRDPELVHDRDNHPSGARADSRHSVPGTAIPGAPTSPAAADEEAEAAREAG